MRLWSIHPGYLDSRGLVAAWRESLLARKVLMGRTRGYRNHPQLERFRGTNDPVAAINSYLLSLWEESARRCYSFDRSKIGSRLAGQPIPVTSGQLEYELSLLKHKVRRRDPSFHGRIMNARNPLPNPVFSQRQGPVESWEYVKDMEAA